jgi:thiosulfate/3-mercaptopyruvate sulfurtransferase
MKAHVLRFLAFLALGIIAIGCDGSPTEPTLTPDPHLLVSTEWLAGQLQNPSVVVLHVGTPANFDAGHIPGARLVALGPLQPTRDGVPMMLADVAVLRDAFEAAGVSNNSHVVIYGDGPLQGARGFFMLDYLGHPRVALLDGGKAAWTADGRELSTTAVSPARGSFTPGVRSERLVTAEWVRDRLQDARVVLVDARPAADYAGEVEPSAQVPRPGHIPGAHNVFWQQALVSTEVPRMKDLEALRALHAATGADPRDAVVAYCFSGMMSSVAYFVARYLGYDARLYDGSFFDWSPRTDLPVARCATPRC